ncbi:MAG: type II toxin-antitoxin system RelE/ParE family toxin [Treponema sp.]|jgi:mRNA-degrading endonuclease RelE of RelBE toxin-antitoxin system|nr:type II toxin-antitoxin system RelE/ParE family toxin [Treponema sp.]
MQVMLHPIPGKYLDRLDGPTKERIKTALQSLGKEPPEGDIVSLSGQPGCFRVRIGGYRVLYLVRDNAIFVTHIEPRGQAYTKKTISKKGRGK